jgi:hypothetical protein
MLLALALLAASPGAGAASVGAVAERFLAAYFEQYPTRATQAGLHSFDGRLEDLSSARIGAWSRTLDETEREAGAVRPTSSDERIDLAILRNAIAWEKFTLAIRDAPGRNPLFWTGILSDAALYPLLREDSPRAARVDALRSRASQVPRLVRQAQAAISKTAAESLAPELVKPAADQASRLAELFAGGLPAFAPELADTGAQAAASLREFADFLGHLHATGSPRLGKDYAEASRIFLGAREPSAVLLRRFERDLAAQRAEAAAYGRSVWSRLSTGTQAPQDDSALLRQLFEKIESDHDTEVEPYVALWRRTVPELEALVRSRDVVTLPEPLTLRILAAPPYLQGQAYGGVFPAGPYKPDGDTLLLLPLPPPEASPKQRETFFRAFNRPFSRMIAAHEVMPGHYLQLKIVAQGPHRIRAVFPDQVFAEGWGTFSERLMLDQGWGGPLERLAHLKKALENCARAIVDIRVHTMNATRAEVDRIVLEEALQDPQLAENLWQRTLTSAPQLVTYHLGSRRFHSLYELARKRRGPEFKPREFTDSLMRAASFPVRADSASR